MQAPGVVVIRNEMIHEARVIPLDGSAHAAPACKCGWAIRAAGSKATRSSSRRRTSRTARAWRQRQRRRAQRDLTLVERLRRVDADTLRYEFTVNDPETYTRPWTAGFDLDQPAGYEIYEYACHEGNLGSRTC